MFFYVFNCYFIIELSVLYTLLIKVLNVLTGNKKILCVIFKLFNTVRK